MSKPRYRQRFTQDELATILHEGATEFKRCGRWQCRCQRGLLHGPYVYRHWREGGHQKKVYVPMRRLAEVLLTLEERQAAAARPRQVAQMLKECHNV